MVHSGREAECQRLSQVWQDSLVSDDRIDQLRKQIAFLECVFVVAHAVPASQLGGLLTNFRDAKAELASLLADPEPIQAESFVSVNEDQHIMQTEQNPTNLIVDPVPITKQEIFIPELSGSNIDPSIDLRQLGAPDQPQRSPIALLALGLLVVG